MYLVVVQKLVPSSIASRGRGLFISRVVVNERYSVAASRECVGCV